MFCVKIRLLLSRSISQWRFKTLLNLYVSYIFCTTDVWSPSNQRRCADLLFMITRPPAPLSLGTQPGGGGGEVFCPARQQTVSFRKACYEFGVFMILYACLFVLSFVRMMFVCRCVHSCILAMFVWIYIYRDAGKWWGFSWTALCLCVCQYWDHNIQSFCSDALCTHVIILIYHWTCSSAVTKSIHLRAILPLL